MMTRIRRLIDALAGSDFDALAITPGPTMLYLTGLHFHVSERPIVALIFPDRPAMIILPELEQAKVDSASVELQAFTYSEDEVNRRAAFAKALNSAALDEKKIGIETLRLRYLELTLLRDSLTNSSIIDADALIAQMRMTKDEAEIGKIERAVAITQDALSKTLPLIQVGMTEIELASELTLQLLRAGSEPEIPFSPIVASGPNSAHPHAFPSTRKLETGDLLILDCGATSESYIADLTRTFAIGEADSQSEQIHSLVLEANREGRAAAAPGVRCQDVDQAARAVIESAGFGEYFNHRTGHGIGLEGHEGPYIRAGNERQLETGMTFTIEPGIYLPKKGGVRVEDNLAITTDGARSLSTFARGLQVVG
jgi:Xaa-Pro dipeptidase